MSGILTRTIGISATLDWRMSGANMNAVGMILKCKGHDYIHSKHKYDLSQGLSTMDRWTSRISQRGNRWKLSKWWRNRAWDKRPLSSIWNLKTPKGIMGPQFGKGWRNIHMQLSMCYANLQWLKRIFFQTTHLMGPDRYSTGLTCQVADPSWISIWSPVHCREWPRAQNQE